MRANQNNFILGSYEETKNIYESRSRLSYIKEIEPIDAIIIGSIFPLQGNQNPPLGEYKYKTSSQDYSGWVFYKNAYTDAVWAYLEDEFILKVDTDISVTDIFQSLKDFKENPSLSEFKFTYNKGDNCSLYEATIKYNSKNTSPGEAIKEFLKYRHPFKDVVQKKEGSWYCGYRMCYPLIIEDSHLLLLKGDTLSLYIKDDFYPIYRVKKYFSEINLMSWTIKSENEKNLWLYNRLGIKNLSLLINRLAGYCTEGVKQYLEKKFKESYHYELTIQLVETFFKLQDEEEPRLIVAQEKLKEYFKIDQIDQIEQEKKGEKIETIEIIG